MRLRIGYAEFGKLTAASASSTSTEANISNTLSIQNVNMAHHASVSQKPTRSRHHVQSVHPLLANTQISLASMQEMMLYQPHRRNLLLSNPC